MILIIQTSHRYGHKIERKTHHKNTSKGKNKLPPPLGITFKKVVLKNCANLNLFTFILRLIRIK